jgi:hypothetical protein
MGYDITFRTLEKISPALQREICEMAAREFSAKSWVQLTEPRLEDDGEFLQGDTRVTVMPVREDVIDSRMGGHPDARLTDLLRVLCAISGTYDVAWEVAHDYGSLGFIQSGIADQELRQFCEGFNELFDGTMGDIDPDDS